MITGQTSFLQALGWAVFNSLWQMALLWVIYQLVTGLFRSIRSSSKSTLATLLLSTGFAWFIYTFFSAWDNPAASGTISSVFTATDNTGITAWLQKALPVASVIYLALLLLPVSGFIRNYRYVKVIRQYGLTKIDVQWRVFVKNLAAQMGIRKPVHIWVSEFITSPVTIGFLKPVILVPLAAVNHLSVQQMESVLLHEISHIRRHDYFINLVINIIRTVLYFNPFVKAFVQIVEREREKSCDEMVLQFQYDPHEYATALLTLEKVNQPDHSFVMAAAGRKNDLLHRVELIMGVNKKKTISFNKLAGIAAGLLCIIAVNAFIISGKNIRSKQTAANNYSTSSFAFLASDGIIEADNASPEALQQVVGSHTGSSVRQLASSLKTNITDGIIAASDIIQANYEVPAEVPVLAQYQEEQVKAAMDASKKVLENAEWKALEKNIADVFTQREKEKLRKSYQKELDKFDWNKWENKLRLAYDYVDWNRVNEQLNKAVSNIRIDSLQKVYNEAICKIDDVSEELTLNQLKGIPDSDISLKMLEEKKREMQKALNKLKATRSKKIVHL